MKEETNLKPLGLTKYESLAYEALIRLGKSSASNVSRESGVPYGRIYDTLNSLANKGLVLIIPEKSKKFVAAPPETMEEAINKKIKELETLKEEIKKMKVIYTTAEEPVEIAKGKRNFYKLIQKMPKREQYEYAIKFTSEVKPEWVRSVKTMINKGIDIRALANYDSKTKDNIQKWKKLVPKLKQRKFEVSGTACEIVDDKAVFFSLIESNVTILIKDKQFAKLMRKLYEIAWEKAEVV